MESWLTSSFSSTLNCVQTLFHTATASASHNCVEVGDGGDHVHVRHSKRPNAEEIVYSKAEWRAFTDGVKAGEFDY